MYSYIKIFRHRDVQPESSIIVKRNKHRFVIYFQQLKIYYEFVSENLVNLHA